MKLIKWLLSTALLAASVASAQQVGGTTNWKTGPAPGNQSNSTVNTQGYTPTAVSIPGFQGWDNFAGPSGWSLTSHTSDSGHTWAVWAPSGFSSQITLNGSGEIQNTTAGVQAAIFSAAASSSNYTACIWMIPSSSAPGVQFLSRGVTTAETGYALYASAGSLALYQYVSGTATSITSTPITWAASTPYQMCLTTQGTTITAALNGSTVIGPLTNAVVPTGNRVAIILLNSPNAVLTGLTIQ